MLHASMKLKAYVLIVVFSLGNSQVLVETISSDLDTDRNPNCTNRNFFQCKSNPTTECIHFQRNFCDGIPHCSDGSDEMPYNETLHEDADGIKCHHLVWSSLSQSGAYINECFLPNRYVGDGTTQCDLGEDECDFDHAFYCQFSPEPDKTDRQCIVRTQFCNGVFDCFDLSDEIPYFPGANGFQCPNHKLRQVKTCVLPQHHVCDGYSDCSLGIDECFCDPVSGDFIENSYSNGQCFRCLDSTFVVPNSQLCDGRFHCADLSDECMCAKKPQICNQICRVGVECQKCLFGEVQCASSPQNSSSICISLGKVCDGVFDCPLREDELNCAVNESESFLCQDQSMYISKLFHCDNKTDCSDGSDEVNCSSIFFECNPTSYNYPNTVHPGAYEVFRPRYTTACDSIPFCEDFEDECDEELCGPDLPEYCNSTRGLQGFICPDNSTFELIASEICDGFPACTVDSPETSGDELYCPNRFYCADYGREKLPIHIPESSRCDGVSDCSDQSDEIGCSNETHFYCRSGPVIYVPRSKVCNGIQDCFDGEDECQLCSVSPFSSDAFLINSYVLQVFIWIIGILSVIGNVSVLVHNLSLFWKKGRGLTRLSYNHRILVTNLATADLLLGIYLICLGIVNYQYEGIYCQRDIQWRASSSCVAMGTIAVISTESCIFLLVTMATMRVCLVTKPFYSVIKRRYVLVGVVVSWIFAFTIALIPLSSSLIDYFVSQVWYKNNPFLTLSSRKEVEDVSTYIWSLNDNDQHGLNNVSRNEDRSLTWNNMMDAIKILNETFQPSLYFGYYSAHGVCLPRLFPNPTQDRSWGFSLGVIITNFLAFVYMLIAYIIIYKVSTVHTRDAGRADADVANSDLQRKITRIIFTNFCCWIPICILAFVSAAGNQLSSEAYAVSAIILLPINSAFNPLLYSDLPDFIWMKVFENTKFGRWVKMKRKERLSTKRSTINTYSGKSDKKKSIPLSIVSHESGTKTTSQGESRL